MKKNINKIVVSGGNGRFANELKKINNEKDFFLSGTMIQPFSSYVEFDCGKTYQDFNEEKLLNGFNKIKFNDFWTKSNETY